MACKIELIDASSRERRLNWLFDFNRRSINVFIRATRTLFDAFFPGLERPG
ncbi:MAG: hypothetical protein L0229_27960 [Blastocatellia bacterium]|nr:hypothetical protein [Blastocatellia bacterium]